MRRFALALLLVPVLLAGCNTYALGPEWRPLSKVIERPSLPFAGDSATTTKGSHVYVVDLEQWLKDYPPGSVEFVALMKHEQAHGRRQFRYQGLPGELALAAWIGRYLTDHKFMWAEEQQGFYFSITHLQKNGRWDLARTISVADAMSHAYKTLGGKRMVSFPEALKWVQDVLAGRWRP